MKYLFVRLSPDIRRRAALAAAQDDIPFPRFCRRRLEQWLGSPVVLSEVEGEVGPWAQIRIPVSESSHRAARITAIDTGVSVSALVSRVLAHYTPHEVELLANAMAREQTRSSGGSDGS